jgi:hypothetical protein
VIALAGFFAITALGAYFAYLTVMVSPTAIGVLTAGVILAVTTAMSGTVALLIREALDGARGRGPEHLKAGRVKGFLSGGAE